MSIDRYLYRFPWLVLLTALALVALGVAGIYAATAGDEEPPSFWESMALRQLVFLGPALAVFGFALVPSYVRLARFSYYLYGLCLAVLFMLAVLRRFDLVIPGVIYPTNNAYSWISVPGTSVKFQPSELMKIAFIVALAYYLRYRKNYRTFAGLLLPLMMALVPTALVLYQPDLGTAMLFLPVLFLMLFAAGARGKHLLAVIAMGLAMVPVFYASMKGYQRMRIDAWLLHPCAERLHFALLERETPPDGDAPGPAAQGDAPRKEAGPPLLVRPHLTDDHKTELVREVTTMWRFRLWRLATLLTYRREKSTFALARDRLFESLETRGYGPESFEALRGFFGTLLSGPGHQLWQAKIAVGSGGLLGRGWLQGTQTRHGLLPEAHTDFLFPTLAEQFGLWGAALVVVLYGLLALFGVDVSFSTTEPYGKLVVVGVVGLFSAQSFLNIAMSIGLMPITGVPLPLMSYGGSSLVSSFLALGLLCNVGVRRLYLIAPRPFEWRE